MKKEQKKTRESLLMSYVTFAFVAIVMMACDREVGRPPTINPVDSLAMVDLYNCMSGDKWRREYSFWNLRDPETWHGIEFGTGEDGLKVVRKINLDFEFELKSDICYIPESIGRLKHLMSLKIKNISCLSGKIPDSIFDCPLETLDIENIECLVGPLSPKIAQLKGTLSTLIIKDCPNFGGVIPAELGECKTMHVSLSGCGFHGTVPYELKNLVNVNLCNNHLTGIDWRYFTVLETIIPAVKQNDISGNVPEEVLALPKWQRLASYIFLPFNEGYGFCNVSLKPLH